MFGGIAHKPAPTCGLYYMHSPPRNHPGLFPGVVSERVFLPQVQLEAHATILQTTSRVTLTQTFINPSATKAIREVKYVFPLYEGISVVAFTCHVADRTIVGEVKEKNEAKQDYTQAVQRGETAGLFEQLDTADTFMTTVGNVPPGVRVVIELTYLGELKHDMEVDGIRFTIPSIISSRYGRTAPGSEAILAQFQNFTPSRGGHSGNILITVDAEMAEGSFIQKILSPSHPISVSMGTTSIAPNDVPEMSKASATLGIQSTHLDTDFVLQIVAKDTGIPKAILETHPTIPNQRALMATLVPKFALSPQSPEIVFVCDRSGSMEGTRIALAKQALQIFLKSLPVGAMFNICSFGSGYSFLWPRSVAYSQKTLDEAVQHVGSLAANYGGTEMLEPLKATVHQRYRDIPLEVMMLTDGAIWNQDILFTYLNEQVQDTTAPIRVYTLGVGSGVSHSLIEGIARAGNGFSQTVGEGEKMDSKVVRMLKGALSPHVNDYSLEVKYAGGIESLNEEEDFEIVERVADSLTVKLDLNEKEDEPNTIKPISLFDPSADPDRSEKPASGASNLHNVATPKIIQAPSRIPPLFAFNRTTVYLLLGPDAPRQTPLSVLLRGTSTHGPLELEFPIQVLDRPGTTIHQLAAKKATYELEQGRGWLAEAKDESGKLLKERYESRFSSMMEREAVRLGVQFQVSGKWCSFVAVEKNRPTEPEKAHTQWEYLEDEAAPEPPHGGLFGMLNKCPSAPGNTSVIGGGTNQAIQSANAFPPGPSSGRAMPENQRAYGGLFSGPPATAAPPSGGLFGGFGTYLPHGDAHGPGSGLSGSVPSAPTPSPQGYQSTQYIQGGGWGSRPSVGTSFGSTSHTLSGPAATGGSLFGGQQQQQQQKPTLFGAMSQPHPKASGLFGASQSQSQPSGGLFGSSQPPHQHSGNPFASTQQHSQQSGGPFRQQSQDPSYHNFGLASDQSHALENFDFDSFLHVKENSTGFGSIGVEFGFEEGQKQQQPQQQPAHQMAQKHQMAQPQQASAFGQSNPAPRPQGNHALQDYQMQCMLLEQQNKKRLLMARQEQDTLASASYGTTNPEGVNSPPKTVKTLAASSRSTCSENVTSPPKTDDETLALLISVQTFEGEWKYSPPLFLALKIREDVVEEARTRLNHHLSSKAAAGETVEYSEAVWATSLAIVCLETKLASLQGSWELIVDKAKAWLSGSVGAERMEEVLDRAKELSDEISKYDGSRMRSGN
ncbi:vault protein inter-alpha-trypsin [Paraphaeosphaeria sporulosa]